MGMYNQSLNDNIDNIKVNANVGKGGDVPTDIDAEDVTYSGYVVADNVKDAIDTLKAITDEREKPWVLIHNFEINDNMSIPLEDLSGYTELKWNTITAGVYATMTTECSIDFLKTKTGSRMYGVGVTTTDQRFIYVEGTNLLSSAKGTTRIGGLLYAR